MDIKCKTNSQIAEYIKELNEYKDMESEGILLKLPCKENDIVWEICKCDDEVYRKFPMTVKVVVPWGSLITTKENEAILWNFYAESDYTYIRKSFYDIGISVFMTEEAADEKIRELEENQ